MILEFSFSSSDSAVIHKRVRYLPLEEVTPHPPTSKCQYIWYTVTAIVIAFNKWSTVY